MNRLLRGLLFSFNSYGLVESDHGRKAHETSCVRVRSFPKVILILPWAFTLLLGDFERLRWF